jgi:hypothetical protein
MHRLTCFATPYFLPTALDATRVPCESALGGASSSSFLAFSMTLRCVCRISPPSEMNSCSPSTYSHKLIKRITLHTRQTHILYVEVYSCIDNINEYAFTSIFHVNIVSCALEFHFSGKELETFERSCKGLFLRILAYCHQSVIRFLLFGPLSRSTRYSISLGK